MDKPILLCTEDSNASTLEELIKQVPDLDNQVSVFPFNGVSTLGHGAVLAELRNKLGNSHTIIVHRDRDCLTDEELAPWVDGYTKQNIITWVTDGSDIESHFCDPAYLSVLFGITIADARSVLNEAIESDYDKFTSTFENKRSEVNKRYLKTGGSPSTEVLQEEWPFWKWIRGKNLLSSTRRVVRERDIGDEKLIGRAHEDYIVAPSLIKVINNILS